MIRSSITREWWLWKLLFWVVSPVTKSISQGAATGLNCLIRSETKGLTGLYWNQCRQGSKSFKFCHFKLCEPWKTLSGVASCERPESSSCNGQAQQIVSCWLFINWKHLKALNKKYNVNLLSYYGRKVSTFSAGKSFPKKTSSGPHSSRNWTICSSSTRQHHRENPKTLCLRKYSRRK